MINIIDIENPNSTERDNEIKRIKNMTSAERSDELKLINNQIKYIKKERFKVILDLCCCALVLGFFIVLWWNLTIALFLLAASVLLKISNQALKK